LLLLFFNAKTKEILIPVRGKDQAIMAEGTGKFRILFKFYGKF